MIFLAPIVKPVLPRLDRQETDGADALAGSAREQKTVILADDGLGPADTCRRGALPEPAARA